MLKILNNADTLKLKTPPNLNYLGRKTFVDECEKCDVPISIFESIFYANMKPSQQQQKIMDLSLF